MFIIVKKFFVTRSNKCIFLYERRGHGKRLNNNILEKKGLKKKRKESQPGEDKRKEDAQIGG